MPSNRSDFLVILSGVVGIVAGLFLAFYWLATTLTPAALAITLVLIVLGGLTFGAPLLWLIARLTRDRRADVYRPDPPQLIDYAPATPANRGAQGRNRCYKVQLQTTGATSDYTCGN